MTHDKSKRATALVWLIEVMSWTVAVAVGVLASAWLQPHDSQILTADNTILTISLIVRECMRVLVNNLVLGKLVSRTYDNRFAVGGAKVGTVINVRKPARFLGRKGEAMQIEAYVEDTVPVALTELAGVDLNFTSLEMTLSLDDLSERVLQPAIAAVANQVDVDIAKLYKKVANAVGTPATVPNAILTYLQASALLSNNATPMDGQRSVVVTPTMEITVVDALKGLFQQATAIAQQYEKGQMGTAAGFTWYMDQNLATHTYGTYVAAAPVINGANQVGSTINTSGWTNADALNEGDIITFDGCNLVNPQSRQSSGSLQQFTVTADIAAGAAGTIAIPVYPPLTPSGALQTVSASPANGARVRVSGASAAVSPQGLGFHKDAFALVCADLEIPNGVHMAERVSDPQLGLSMAVIQDFDIKTRQFPLRVDMLYGVAALRPELATRVQS